MKLEKTDFQNIEIYRYIFNAMLMSENPLQLDAVAQCFATSVPIDHPEYELLIQAGLKRRAELLFNAQPERS